MQLSQHKLESYDAILTFYRFYLIILALEVCDGIENRVLVWWSRSSVIRAATAEDVEAEKEMIEMDAVRQKIVEFFIPTWLKMGSLTCVLTAC